MKVIDERKEKEFTPTGMVEVAPIERPDTSAILADYNLVRDFSKKANCLGKVEQQKLDEYLYCIEEIFEGRTIADYFTAFKLAAQQGFDTFVDIGCATGHQSELFRNSGIQYVGIESCPGLFWRPDETTYIEARYPCKIPQEVMDNKVMGASRLCVGYLTCDYEAIASQFDAFLLSAPALACESMARLYKESFAVRDHECPDNHWVWFHQSKLKI